MTELTIPDKLRALELDAKLAGELEERRDPSLRIHLGIILGGAPLPAESPESITIDVPCEVEALEDRTEVPREE